MKVLVTGANGFLGSWLVRYLSQQGLEVRILRRKNSDLSELEGLKFEEAIGDITDAASLPAAFEDIDSVFHLAGLIAYTRAQRPLMDKVNIVGTENILKACQEKKIRRLLHMSSVVAVGASFNGEVLNEDSPYNLQHLNLGYFETKRIAEERVLSAVNEGLDAVIVNPSTVYGPGDAKKGSRGTQLKVAQGRFPFYTPGGVNIAHVSDLVEAVHAAWERGKTGERYILAGENITIKKLFEIIAEKAGVAPPKILLPKPVLHTLGSIGDLLEKIGKKGPLSSENAWTASMYHWFDSSKAQNELGLKVTPAEEAIRDSVEWSKKNGLI